MAAIVERATDPTELARVQDLLRYCAVSREQRRSVCDLRRRWYEEGANTGRAAIYNKIRPHLDRVGSYIFAPDTARFGPLFPVAHRADWLGATSTVADEVRNSWRDAGADLIASRQVEWALVYGGTLGKVQIDRHTGFRLGYIQPWDFGVSREDVPELDEQDTLAHWYTLSVPQLERWAHGAKNETAILAAAREHAKPGSGPTRSGLVVTSTAGGNISGSFPGDAPESSDLGAIVEEPLITLADIWERRIFKRRDWKGKDEEYEDWLVTTVVENVALVTQRRNPDLPWTRTGQHVLAAELPFYGVVPRPQPDYFWGRAEVAGLQQLQQWLEDHIDDMKANMKRILNPSKFVSGMGEDDEVIRALTSPGGVAFAQDPTSKMEEVKATVPPEAFQLLKEILGMYADASGVPEILEGTGQPGVRNTGQQTQLAGIAGGRIRKMALFVEDALGQAATKALRMMQRHDDTAYPMSDDSGTTFLLADLPPGTHLRVSAHSSSPIYQEQTTQKATLLHRAGAIGPEDLVELVDPPGRDELKAKAKVIAKNKSEMQQEGLRIAEMKATKKK